MYVQVRNAYWSGAPKNLEKLAEDFSQTYRREKNSFKRADLLKTLTPELEKSYSGAQGQKDFAFRTTQLLSIGPYDSQKGGFKVSLPHDAEQVESVLAKDSDLSKNNHHWRFRFVGVPHEELFYKPKDEAEAREIEAVLAPHRGNGQEPVFTFIQFAGSEIGTLTKDGGLSDVALIGVDAITAIDRDSGKQLLTLAGQDLGPMEVQCRSTREALKLPEPKSTTPTGLGAMNTVSGPSC
ncbi:hypothetical protein B0T49_20310 [Chromobacterium violaceum]|nr:hypothetical protein B0T48_17955 [Chromobacterium violaceum]OQS46208.1 hypothetical protein B0T49_20310 [Chromobacterium violaceum]